MFSFKFTNLKICFIKNGYIFCEGKIVRLVKLLLKYVVNKYKISSNTYRVKFILELFRIDSKYNKECMNIF